MPHFARLSLGRAGGQVFRNGSTAARTVTFPGVPWVFARDGPIVVKRGGVLLGGAIVEPTER